LIYLKAGEKNSQGTVLIFKEKSITFVVPIVI
jgi:hypothetical protein